MKTKIIFVLPLIVLLFSCAKERTIEVSAINPATGIGYADLRVTIYASKTGPDGEELTKVYEGNLDNNGHIYATFKVKKGRYYVIKCQSPTNVNVCYTNNTTYTYDIHDPNNKEFIFEIAPCGNLRVHFHNQNCQGPNDTLEFYYVSAQVPFGVSGVPTILTGCVNILDDPISFPMGQRNYMWKVIRNGAEQTFEGSVFVEPNATSILEVFY